MKAIILLNFIILVTFTYAQSNLSIFNNNGQQFYVVLNGIRQNSKPETNVQVSQIKNGSYSVKVIFADGKTPDIDKNFLIDAPYDITTRIVFKKGKGKLQLMGMEPTHGVIQEAVVYRPNDAAVYSDMVVVNSVSNATTNSSSNIQGNSTGVNMNVNVTESPNTSVQTSNTTSTTTGTIPEENVNLNMNLSVGGVNVNLNANASGTGLGTGATVTETTTSTTSTSSTVTTSSNSSSNQINTNIQLNGNSQMIQNQQNFENQNNTQFQQAAHSSRVNCTKTMNRLEAFKAELKDQSFEEDRLEALQLEMKSTCLTTAQAEQLLDLFTFDENRLEVAKYLSDRLTDRDNAGALAKKLTFDSNKMEYRRYLSE
ncbi:MAG: DUF4476 domain-containing protein [Sphingomonadales bacterium]